MEGQAVKTRIWKTRAVRSRAAVLVAVVGLVASTSPASAGQGAALSYNVNGTVTDPIGRLLDGASGRPWVTVSDGDGAADTTQGSGTYHLQQDASRIGFVPVHAWSDHTDPHAGGVYVAAPLDSLATYDFSVDYRIGATLAAEHISVADGPATITVNITSHAPSPGTPGAGSGDSCVSVDDSRSGTHEASYVGANPNGSHQWSLDLTIPAGEPDATHNLAVSAKTCDTSEALTSTKTVGYTIDSTAPVVTALAPFDGHNTIYANQPLQAQAHDQGPAGLDSSGFSFELTNRNTGATSTHTATYSATSQAATTPPVALTDDHDYTMVVTVADRAGNTTTASHAPYTGANPATDGGFRKIALTTEPADTTLLDGDDNNTPGVSCTIAPENPNDPLSAPMATCPNTILDLSSTDVTLSSSRHSWDTGFITHTAGLSAATVVHPVLGAKAVTDYQPTGTNWGPHRVDLPYRIGDQADLPSTFVTDPTQLDLGTLKLRLDATWTGTTSTTLSLTGETANPSSQNDTGTCPRPLDTNANGCSTDPLATQYVVYVEPVGGETPGAVMARLDVNTLSESESVGRFLILASRAELAALSQEPSVSKVNNPWRERLSRYDYEGHQIRTLNEGECDRFMSVASMAVDESDRFEYDISEDCSVSNPRTSSDLILDGEGPVESALAEHVDGSTTTSSGPLCFEWKPSAHGGEELDPFQLLQPTLVSWWWGCGGGGSGPPPPPPKTNYIWASQTLYDPVKVKIARLNTTLLRWYTPTHTWLHDSVGDGEYYSYTAALATTFKTWNSPENNELVLYNRECTNSVKCKSAAGWWKANFHTDFAHCNKDTWQNLRLENVTVSQPAVEDKDSRRVEFLQRTPCPVPGGYTHATKIELRDSKTI